jgi:outer membrane protein TolC
MKQTIILIISISFSFVLFSQENSYSFTVDEAINYSLKNNYSAKNSVLDVEIAEKVMTEYKAFGLPQIDGKVDYNNYLIQNITLIPSEIVGGPPGEFEEVIFGAKQNLNATVTLTQVIFDGAYIVALQSTKAYLKISNLSKVKTEQEIREAVINAYGSVLVAREAILILEDNIVTLEKNLNETKAYLENGFAEVQDFEQQQITLLNTENQLNKSVRLEIIAGKMLNLVLGIPIEIPVELKDSLEHLALSSTDLNLINENFVLDNHIDFKIADNRVVTQELQLKYEKSKNIPTLNAFINYSTFAQNNNNIFFKNNGRWFDSSLFGVSLNIPIFSSLERKSRTQQAKMSLNQRVIELDETTEKLKLQVATARNKYQFALDQFQTLKQNLVLAESIAEKEQIKFFEGLSTSFNLANAQNQLYRTQQNYIESILGIIESKVELENALNIY